MSHVATVDLHIKDLDALKRACARLGLELREGQTSYRWYGQHVGDYPLPEGFKASELGQCEHAIAVPGLPHAYEIGVVRRRDGKPGYSLLWDFYQGGYGLEEKVGPECGRLRQAYAVEVARKQARKQGFRVQEQTGTDGKVRLVCTR